MARRAFLATREIPRCAIGALRAEPAVLRRILGARRGGRFGAAIAITGAVLALPPPWLPAALALHLVGTWLLPISGGDARLLGYRERLRLTSWTVGPLLLVAGPARWALPGAGPGLLAIALGHALAARGLRRGLDARRPAPGPGARRPEARPGTS